MCEQICLAFFSLKKGVRIMSNIENKRKKIRLITSKNAGPNA